VFQTLADELWEEKRQPRDVPARPHKAGDEPARYRIACAREDDGDGLGRLLGGEGGERACPNQDHLNLECNQFGREGGELLGLPLGRSVLDHDVAALNVTKAAQSFHGRRVTDGGSYQSG
jgi:hypothetical protein